MKTFTVLGIDQGLASCGYGLIQFKETKTGILFDKVLDKGLIKTTPKNTTPERLVMIYNILKNQIDKYSPEIIACERLFYTTPQKGGRNKSASIVTTNMVTGIIHYLAGIEKIKIVDFVPSSVKKAITGNGNASKEDMMKQIPIILKLKPEETKIEHIADALGIAYTAGIKKNDKDEEEESSSKKEIKKKKEELKTKTENKASKKVTKNKTSKKKAEVS